MGGLEQAVERTRRYAAFFDCLLSDDDLYRWLISGKTYSAQSLKRLFPQKTKSRTDLSASKLIQAKRIAKLVSFLPTVSTVAVTGSLAISNAKPEDDIDLMIITKANTLWLTRLFLIPLISLFFKRRLPGMKEIKDTICLNLWLDETALAVPENKRNLYTAHEVLQAKPLSDRGNTYTKFISANSWTKKYLANAYVLACRGPVISANLSSSRMRGSIDIDSHFRGNDNTIRSGMTVFLKTLNYLAFRLQYAYMKRKITRETITLHSAYFHPNDYSARLNLDG